jgi:hypothetical protein
MRGRKSSQKWRKPLAFGIWTLKDPNVGENEGSEDDDPPSSFVVESLPDPDSDSATSPSSSELHQPIRLCVAHKSKPLRLP